MCSWLWLYMGEWVLRERLVKAIRKCLETPPGLFEIALWPPGLTALPLVD